MGWFEIARFCGLRAQKLAISFLRFPFLAKHDSVAASEGDAVRNLIGRVAMIEMVGPVLTRSLQPFPVPVRTLDAIHLAALEFVRAQKQSVQLASYDERLLAAARFLGIAEWSASQ
jgi:hypothetical protein